MNRDVEMFNSSSWPTRLILAFRVYQTSKQERVDGGSLHLSALLLR